MQERLEALRPAPRRARDESRPDVLEDRRLYESTVQAILWIVGLVYYLKGFGEPNLPFEDRTATILAGFAAYSSGVVVLQIARRVRYGSVVLRLAGATIVPGRSLEATLVIPRGRPFDNLMVELRPRTAAAKENAPENPPLASRLVAVRSEMTNVRTGAPLEVPIRLAIPPIAHGLRHSPSGRSRYRLLVHGETAGLGLEASFELIEEQQRPVAATRDVRVQVERGPRGRPSPAPTTATRLVLALSVLAITACDGDGGTGPAPGPDAGGHIVFERDVLEPAIVVMNGDGSRERVVLEQPGGRDPSWSPDGSRIAFSARRGADTEPALYVMRADGTEIQRLAGSLLLAPTDPSWSPDGQFLAVSDAFNTGIAVLPSGGGALQRIREGGGWPDWSPDGRFIAFHYVEEEIFHVFVMDADGGNVRRVTSPPEGGDSPAWSPDGRRIAFTHGEGNGDTDIFVIDADGGGRRRLTDFPRGVLAFQPTWSPDGERIAFTRTDGIFSISADGGDLARLTRAAEDSDPDWR